MFVTESGMRLPSKAEVMLVTSEQLDGGKSLAGQPSTRVPVALHEVPKPGPSNEPYRRRAPNVIVVVLDDVGFAQLGCYGSDIATPNIDGIAARGLRFTNFHTTAVCSATRASLLTGRNHHRVGMGLVPDTPRVFPGYTGQVPPEAATVAQVLKDAGWATFAIGKWHLTPRDQKTPAGPFHAWPLGMGFDRYYGFLGPDSNHWAPELVRDNSYVSPPSSPEEGYHLTEDLADEAIRQMRQIRIHQPDRPFLCWFATGAAHAPHHVPRTWIDRYAGAFDAGWDAWRTQTLERQKSLGIVPKGAELAPRPDWVQAWESLTPDARRAYARAHEVFAGFLEHTDHQIGRVIDAVAGFGELDNTVVMVVSDNGASAEGGPHGLVNERRMSAEHEDPFQLFLEHVEELGGWTTYGHYPWGWAFAGNTPLNRWKRYTFEGGVRDPFILAWPGVVPDPGGIRDQYCHAIDVAPTILDGLGVLPPREVRGATQLSFDGVSLRSVLADPEASPARLSQYYECMGSRAMYHDGWKVVTNHVGKMIAAERRLIPGSQDFRSDEWALFHVAEDFGEEHDLAAAHPELVDELVGLWWSEAGRNQVLPLGDGNREVGVDTLHLPYKTTRSRYVLLGGDALHESAGPQLAGGFTIRAEFRRPLRDEDAGVILEQGDWTNGWAWLLLGSEMVWLLNHLGEFVHRVSTPRPVGTRSITVTGRRVEPQGMSLRIDTDTQRIGGGVIPIDLPSTWAFNGSFLRVGHSTPFPVSTDYEPPFTLTVPLERVLIETGPPPANEYEAMVEHAMRRQ